MRKSLEILSIDETVVRANGKCYFVYAAIDVERNELIDESLYNEKLPHN